MCFSLSFQVFSNYVNDEEQTQAQMAILGQEMKNLRSELQEHRFIAVDGNPRPKPKKKTECNTILQLLPHKRTQPNLVPQEDTRRRTEMN